MTRPKKIPDPADLVRLPGQLFEQGAELRGQTNIKLSDLFEWLNTFQPVFLHVAPALLDPRVTDADWDKAASARWGAVTGVKVRIVAVQKAANDFVAAVVGFVSGLSISPSYDVDDNKFELDYVLSAAEWEALHPATDKFLLELEPISEVL